MIFRYFFSFENTAKPNKTITKSIRKHARNIMGSNPAMRIRLDCSMVPAPSLEATSNGLASNGFRRNNQTRSAEIPSRSSVPTHGHDRANLLLFARKRVFRSFKFIMVPRLLLFRKLIIALAPNSASGEPRVAHILLAHHGGSPC